MGGPEQRSCGAASCIDCKLVWTSINANVRAGAWWEATNMKVRWPKFVDVSSVKVPEVDGLLSLSMTVKAKTTIVKERISIASPAHTGAVLHVKRAFALSFFLMRVRCGR